MAEQVTNQEAPVVAQEADKKPVANVTTKPGGKGKTVSKAKTKAKAKTADKAKPKAKGKDKAKAKPKGKAKAKADKKVKRPAKDDARKVAAATDGSLNTDQLRILRALSSGKELTRGDLKEAVGIGRDGKYSQKWLDGLWALATKRPPLIAIGNYEKDRKSYHTITAKGKEVLKKAEEAGKKAKAEAA